MKIPFSLKVLALCIFLIFTVNTIVYSAPVHVAKLEFSSDLARIAERWINTKKQSDQKSVIIIQDAHDNFTVQKNISALIHEVLPQTPEDDILVGVEGAVGELSASMLRTMPVRDARDYAAEKLVREGYLTGAEHAAIASEESLHLWGVEDEALFVDNFLTYYAIQKNKTRINRSIGIVEKHLNSLSAEIYNPALIQFLDLKSRYLNAEVSVETYLADVDSYVKRSAVSREKYIHYQLLLEIVSIEREYDHGRFEKEKNAFLQKNADLFQDNISESISDEEVVKLWRVYAKNFSREYPQIARRSVIISKYRLLDYAALLRDVRLLSHDIESALARNDKERSLLDLQKNFQVFARFITATASRDDVLAIRSCCATRHPHSDGTKGNKRQCSVRAVKDFISSQNSAVQQALDELSSYYSQALHFYEQATKREDVMVENLLNQMKKTNRQTGLLVIGGYHTAGVKEILAQQGISYIVITPEIKSLVDKTGYMERMTGKLAPIAPHLTSYVTLPGTSHINVLFEELAKRNSNVDTSLLKVFQRYYEDAIIHNMDWASRLKLLSDTVEDPLMRQRIDGLYRLAKKSITEDRFVERAGHDSLRSETIDEIMRKDHIVKQVEDLFRSLDTSSLLDASVRPAINSQHDDKKSDVVELSSHTKLLNKKIVFLNIKHILRKNTNKALLQGRLQRLIAMMNAGRTVGILYEKDERDRVEELIKKYYVESSFDFPFEERCIFILRIVFKMASKLNSLLDELQIQNDDALWIADHTSVFPDVQFDTLKTYDSGVDNLSVEVRRYADIDAVLNSLALPRTEGASHDSTPMPDHAAEVPVQELEPRPSHDTFDEDDNVPDPHGSTQVAHSQSSLPRAQILSPGEKTQTVRKIDTLIEMFIEEENVDLKEKILLQIINRYGKTAQPHAVGLLEHAEAPYQYAGVRILLELQDSGSLRHLIHAYCTETLDISVQNEIVDGLIAMGQRATDQVLQSIGSQEDFAKEQSARLLLKLPEYETQVNTLLKLFFEENDTYVKDMLAQKLARFESTLTERLVVLLKEPKDVQWPDHKTDVLHIAHNMRQIERNIVFIQALSVDDIPVRDLAIDLCYASLAELSSDQLKELKNICSANAIIFDRSTLAALVVKGGDAFVNDLLRKAGAISQSIPHPDTIISDDKRGLSKIIVPFVSVFAAFLIFFSPVIDFIPNKKFAIPSVPIVAITEFIDAAYTRFFPLSLKRLPRTWQDRFQESVPEKMAYLERGFIAERVLYENQERGLQIQWTRPYEDAFLSVVPVSKKYLTDSCDISRGCGFLYKDVRDAFYSMAESAQKSGISLRLNETWRSYEYQLGLVKNYIVQNDTIAIAQPGTSEHHRIAIDIANTSDPAILQWLNKNAADFGFEMSYPKDAPAKYGVKYEPWHWRFNPYGIEKPREGSYAHTFMTKDMAVKKAYQGLRTDPALKSVYDEFDVYMREYVQKIDDETSRNKIKMRMLQGDWFSLARASDFFVHTQWEKQYAAVDIVLAYIEANLSSMSFELQRMLFANLWWVIEKDRISGPGKLMHFRPVIDRMAIASYVYHHITQSESYTPLKKKLADSSINMLLSRQTAEAIEDLFSDMLYLKPHNPLYRDADYGAVLVTIVPVLLAKHADLPTERQKSFARAVDFFAKAEHTEVVRFFPHEAVFRAFKSMIIESEYYKWFHFVNDSTSEVIQKYKEAIVEGTIDTRIFIRSILVERDDVYRFLLPFLSLEHTDINWKVSKTEAWKLHYLAVDVLGRRIKNGKTEAGHAEEIYQKIKNFRDTGDGYELISDDFIYYRNNVNVTKRLIDDLGLFDKSARSSQLILPSLPRLMYASVFALPSIMQTRTPLDSAALALGAPYYGEADIVLAELEKLMDGLTDENRHVRFRNAQKIEDLLYANMEVAERVIEALEDTRWHVRWHMLNILRRAKCFYYEDEIKTRLKDPQEEVVIGAIQTLKEIGSKRAIRDLTILASSRQQYRDEVRQALKEIRLRAGIDDISDDEKKRIALQLGKLFNSGTSESRWAAGNVLLDELNNNYGLQLYMKEILIGAKSDPSRWKERFHIIRILKEIGDIQNVEVISPFLWDDHSEVARIAIDALTYLGGDTAETQLRRFVDSPKHRRLIDHARTALEFIEETSVYLIGLSDADRREIGRFISLLGHDQRLHRYHAYMLLKKKIIDSNTMIARGRGFMGIGSDFEAYKGILYSALISDRPRVRLNSLELVSATHIGGSEKYIVPLLGDSFYAVRDQALTYLKEHGTAQSISPLKEFLKAGMPSAQQVLAKAAIDAIESREKEREKEKYAWRDQGIFDAPDEAPLDQLERLMERLSTHDIDSRQKYIAEVVALIKSNASHCDELFEGLYRDISKQTEFTQLAIVDITEKLRIDEHQHNIYRFVQSENMELKKRTIEVLQTIGSPQAIEVLRPLLDHPSNDVQRWTRDALDELRRKHSIPTDDGFVRKIAIGFTVAALTIWIWYAFFLVKTGSRLLAFFGSFIPFVGRSREKISTHEQKREARRAALKLIGGGFLSGGLLITEIYTSFMQATAFRGLNSLAYSNLKDLESDDLPSQLESAASFNSYSVPASNDTLKKFSYYDLRGFTRLKNMAIKLRDQGYAVVRYAAHSFLNAQLIRLGIEPGYERVYAPFPVEDGTLDPADITSEHTNRGVVLLARDRKIMYQKVLREDVFESLEDIPFLLRELLARAETQSYWRPVPHTYAPIILLRFFYVFALRLLGMGSGGGSTILTQSVKLARSPGGTTNESIREKIYQMLGAWRLLYRDGFGTAKTRTEAFVTYCNEVYMGEARIEGNGRAHNRPAKGFSEGVLLRFGRSMSSLRKDLLLGESNPTDRKRKALALKQAAVIVSVLPAPNHYKKREEHFNKKANVYIKFLAEKGVITPALAREAIRYPVALENNVLHDPQRVIYGTAWVSIRRFIEKVFWHQGFREPFSKFYENMNFIIQSTYDHALQLDLHSRFEGKRQQGLIGSMKDKAYVRGKYFNGADAGLTSGGFTKGNDLENVKYGVLLVKREKHGNSVIAEYASDKLVNHEGFLNLGSTAKLRVLIDYLQTVEWLYRNPHKLKSLQHAFVSLTQPGNVFGNRAVLDDAQSSNSLLWWVDSYKDRRFSDLISSAMTERMYDTGDKQFFTNGNWYAPQNDDSGRAVIPQLQNVRDAFAHSTNLVFVRIYEEIRDIEICKWLVNNPGQEISFHELEAKAWPAIYQRWKELGYDFDYNAAFHSGLSGALGSSGDSPDALMVALDAVLRPVPKKAVFVDKIYGALGTPYQINFQHIDSLNGHLPESDLIHPVIKKEVVGALRGVVENGTGGFAHDSHYLVFGKTGTATDTIANSSRVRNERFRTASFIFGVGDIIGSVVLWVDKDVNTYSFSSKLATRLFKHEILPLLAKHGYIQNGQAPVQFPSIASSTHAEDIVTARVRTVMHDVIQAPVHDSQWQKEPIDRRDFLASLLPKSWRDKISAGVLLIAGAVAYAGTDPGTHRLYAAASSFDFSDLLALGVLAGFFIIETESNSRIKRFIARGRSRVASLLVLCKDSVKSILPLKQITRFGIGGAIVLSLGAAVKFGYFTHLPELVPFVVFSSACVSLGLLGLAVYALTRLVKTKRVDRFFRLFLELNSSEGMYSEKRRKFILGSLSGTVATSVFAWELKTHFIQASFFSGVNLLNRWHLGDGPARLFVVPEQNETERQLSFYDMRGYTRFDELQKFLIERGFRIAQQVRHSVLTRLLSPLGLHVPYAEPNPNTGLRLFNRDGESMYTHSIQDNSFERFEDIPPILLQLICAAETRNYFDQNPVHAPVLNERVFLNTLLLLLGRGNGAGSTIATQREKMLGSAGAVTHGVLGKMRQMVSADMMMYHDGFDTTRAREQVFLDYVNRVYLGKGFAYDDQKSAKKRPLPIVGFADAFKAYFDLEMAELSAILTSTRVSDFHEKARAIKKVALLASLLPAPNTMSRARLEKRANAHIAYLVQAGFLTLRLGQAAQKKEVQLESHPLRQAPRLVRGTAWSSVQNLISQGMQWKDDSFARYFPNMNIGINTTYDNRLQFALHHRFAAGSPYSMKNNTYAREKGYYQKHCLRPRNALNDINYSVYIVKPGADRHEVVAEYDSSRAFNSDGYLELGSSVKVRVLTDFLQIVEYLYFNPEERKTIIDRIDHLYANSNPYNNPNRLSANERGDTLAHWVDAFVQKHAAATINEVLDAAMQRQYSTKPDVFYTGGNEYTPTNYGNPRDERMSVEDAFSDSVNLVFVRMFRDVRDVYIGHLLNYAEDKSIDLGATYAQYLESEDFMRVLHTKKKSDIEAWLKHGFFYFLEEIAFGSIHHSWQTMGYPFDSIVPHLGTALGSSRENARSLTGFMAFLHTGNTDLPTNIRSLELGGGTPYETRLEYEGLGTRKSKEEKPLFSTEVKEHVLAALKHAVETGTASGAKYFGGRDVHPGYSIYGKTGTGDNRSSRTASFVFGVDQGLVGTFVMWVDKKPEDFEFTSAMATRIFRKEIMPIIKRHKNLYADNSDDSMRDQIARLLPPAHGPPSNEHIDEGKRSLLRAGLRFLRRAAVMLIVAAFLSLGSIGSSMLYAGELSRNYVHAFLVDRSAEVINHWHTHHKSLQSSLHETQRLRDFFARYRNWNHADIMSSLAPYVRANLKKIKSSREKDHLERDIILALYHYVKDAPFYHPEGFDYTLTIHHPITISGARTCFSGSELLIGLYNKFGLGGRTLIVEVFTPEEAGHVALFYLKPDATGRRMPFLMDVNSTMVVNGVRDLDYQFQYEKIGVYDLSNNEMFYESYDSFLKKVKQGRVAFSTKAVRESNDIIFKAVSPAYLELFNKKIDRVNHLIRPEVNRITDALGIIDEMIEYMRQRMIFFENGDAGRTVYKQSEQYWYGLRHSRYLIQFKKIDIYARRGFAAHQRRDFKSAVARYEIARATLSRIEPELRDEGYHKARADLDRLLASARAGKTTFPPLIPEIRLGYEDTTSQEQASDFDSVQDLMSAYKDRIENGTVEERVFLRTVMNRNFQAAQFKHFIGFASLEKAHTWSLARDEAWKMNYMALDVLLNNFDLLSSLQQDRLSLAVDKIWRTAPVDEKWLVYTSANLNVTRQLIRKLVKSQNIRLLQKLISSRARDVGHFFTGNAFSQPLFSAGTRAILPFSRSEVFHLGAAGHLSDLVFSLTYYAARTSAEALELIHFRADEGVLRTYTPQVLDTLKQMRARYVDFNLGGSHIENSDGTISPAVARIIARIVQDGYTIGIHTYSHPDKTQLAQYSRKEIADEIVKTQRIINRALVQAGTDPYFCTHFATPGSIENLGQRLKSVVDHFYTPEHPDSLYSVYGVTDIRQVYPYADKQTGLYLSQHWKGTRRDRWDISTQDSVMFREWFRPNQIFRKMKGLFVHDKPLVFLFQPSKAGMEADMRDLWGLMGRSYASIIPVKKPNSQLVTKVSEADHMFMDVLEQYKELCESDRAEGRKILRSRLQSMYGPSDFDILFRFANSDTSHDWGVSKTHAWKLNFMAFDVLLRNYAQLSVEQKNKIESAFKKQLAAQPINTNRLLYTADSLGVTRDHIYGLGADIGIIQTDKEIETDVSITSAAEGLSRATQDILLNLIETYKEACSTGTVQERVLLRDRICLSEGDPFELLCPYLDYESMHAWGMSNDDAWKMDYMAREVLLRSFHRFDPAKQYAIAQSMIAFMQMTEKGVLPVTTKQFYTNENLAVTYSMIQSLMAEENIDVRSIEEPKSGVRFFESIKNSFVRVGISVKDFLLNSIGVIISVFAFLGISYYALRRYWHRRTHSAPSLRQLYIDTHLEEQSAQVLTVWHQRFLPLQDKLLKGERLGTFFAGFSGWEEPDVIDRLAQYIKTGVRKAGRLEGQLLERDILLAFYHYVKDQPFGHPEGKRTVTATIFDDEIMEGKRTCFSGSELLLGIFSKIGFSNRVLVIDVMTFKKDGHVALFYFRPTPDGKREPFVMDVNYHQRHIDSAGGIHENLDWQVPYQVIGYLDLKTKRMVYQSYDEFYQQWKKTGGMSALHVQESNDVLLKILSPYFKGIVEAEWAKSTQEYNERDNPDFRQAFLRIDAILHFANTLKNVQKDVAKVLGYSDLAQKRFETAQNYYEGIRKRRQELMLSYAEYHASLGAIAHHDQRFKKALNFYARAGRVLNRIPLDERTEGFSSLKETLEALFIQAVFQDRLRIIRPLKYFSEDTSGLKMNADKRLYAPWEKWQGLFKRATNFFLKSVAAIAFLSSFYLQKLITRDEQSFLDADAGFFSGFADYLKPVFVFVIEQWIVFASLAVATGIFIGFRYLKYRFLTRVKPSLYGRTSYWRGIRFPSKLERDTAIALKAVRLMRKPKKGVTWQVPFEKKKGVVGYVDFYVKKLRYLAILEPHGTWEEPIDTYRRKRLDAYAGTWVDGIKRQYFFRTVSELCNKVLPDLLGRPLKPRELKRMRKMVASAERETLFPSLYKYLRRLRTIGLILGPLFLWAYSSFANSNIAASYQWRAVEKVLKKIRYEYLQMNVLDGSGMLLIAIGVGIVYALLKKSPPSFSSSVNAKNRYGSEAIDIIAEIVPEPEDDDNDSIVFVSKPDISGIPCKVADGIALSPAEYTMLKHALKKVQNRYVGMLLDFYHRDGEIVVTASEPFNVAQDRILHVPYAVLREATVEGEESAAFSQLVNRVLAYGLWYESDDAQDVTDVALAIFERKVNKAIHREPANQYFVELERIFRKKETTTLRYFFNELYWLYFELLVPPGDFEEKLLERAKAFGVEKTIDPLIKMGKEDKEMYLKAALIIAVSALRIEIEKVDSEAAYFLQETIQVHFNDLWALMAQSFAHMREFTDQQTLGHSLYSNTFKAFDAQKRDADHGTAYLFWHANELLVKKSKEGFSIAVAVHKDLRADRRFRLIKQIINSQRERGISIHFVKKEDAADIILAFDDARDLVGDNVFRFSRDELQFRSEILFFDTVITLILADSASRKTHGLVDLREYENTWLHSFNGTFKIRPELVAYMNQYIADIASTDSLIKIAA